MRSSSHPCPKEISVGPDPPISLQGKSRCSYMDVRSLPDQYAEVRGLAVVGFEYVVAGSSGAAREYPSLRTDRFRWRSTCWTRSGTLRLRARGEQQGSSTRQDLKVAKRFARARSLSTVSGAENCEPKGRSALISIGPRWSQSFRTPVRDSR